MCLTTGTGLRMDNPTWEVIERILHSLSRLPPDRDYMIYESSAEPCSYMQTRPERGKDTFGIEYRDGEAKRHFWQGGVCICVVVVMFRSYHSQDGRWRKMGEWKDVSRHFKFDY
jgi:hypothetical protein